MSGHNFSTPFDLERIYRGSAGDLDFQAILDQVTPADEAMLVDLVEADSRLRMRLELPVTASRYLDRIPGDRATPLVVDVVVDMALRAIAGTGPLDEQAIHALVARHPGHEGAIRDAAAMTALLCSTTGLHDRASGRPKTLPCEFGPDLENGDRRYLLVERLGGGSFGQVYLAVDRLLSDEDYAAKVAIKIFSHAVLDAWGRERLREEATKARRVEHEHVVRVIDLGVSDLTEEYIVFEYVAGGDLARWYRHQPRPLDARLAASMIASIARGVHASHMAGLVHCDLKPNNVLVTTDGVPRITDFGIAKRHELIDRPDSAEPNASGQVVGNLAFIAPEQYRGEATANNIPADVYALGGMLYWLVAGKLANGNDLQEIAARHRKGAGGTVSPSLRTIRGSVALELDLICQRALNPAPDGRYASAAAFADDLEAWLRFESPSSIRTSPIRRLSLWTRRHRALAATLLIILALIGGGVFAVHRATVAEARADEQEQANANAKTVLLQFAANIEQSNEERLAYQILPVVWLAEWVFDPRVLGDGPERLALWDLRVQSIRTLLEQARAEGSDSHLEILIWESSLGFWLLQDAEYRQAEELLSRSVTEWRAILGEDDPWTAQFQALTDCATVGNLLSEHDVPAATNSELHTLTTQLRQAEQLIAQRKFGSPIHVTVLRHIVMSTGPDALDQPALHGEAQKLLDMLTE